MCDVRVWMCGESVGVWVCDVMDVWGECDYVSGYVEYTIGTKSVGVVVVLRPACVCFFARNGLVNEVKFLGLNPKNSVISIRLSVPF